MPGERRSDRALAQKVSQSLINHGFRAPCRIEVAVRGSDVILSGTIQFPNQRRNAIRSVQTITGVRRVIDHLHVQEHVIWADRMPGAHKPSPPSIEI